MHRYLKILAISFIFISSSNSASAEIKSIEIEKANSEQLAAATGHYAKSRTLLIAAIREFDKARKIASPGSLLDVDEFRNILISRAEELERVLDPQPRISESGVKFDAYPSIIGEK
ncbi:MAG: hypothetical protein KDD56_07675 [Bdellovibrionales bacterium]|nr:hypothetical protein [Bdellovibrionales bacterium]